MRTRLHLRIAASALLASGAFLVLATAFPDDSGTFPANGRSWTADNGNGTYSNPLFYEEFEDPDVIRVGDDYYLAGTTMHMNPAVIVLHSKDLVTRSTAPGTSSVWFRANRSAYPRKTGSSVAAERTRPSRSPRAIRTLAVA
ncbi:MAG: family 43 glycosylhydrolase [Vicinamibacteria bacterium]|nr:family 43 glycosylhydrolase [Vicinamibacteria bacterium]